MMILKNWKFVCVGEFSPFIAPEAVVKTYKGDVDSHPTLGDNATGICISRPVAYDPESRIITTASGSRYTLGEPDAAYLAQFPEAVNMAHDSLKGLPTGA